MPRQCALLEEPHYGDANRHDTIKFVKGAGDKTDKNEVHEWYIEDCILTGSLLSSTKEYGEMCRRSGPFRGLTMYFVTSHAQCPGIDQLVQACVQSGAIVSETPEYADVCIASFWEELEGLSAVDRPLTVYSNNNHNPNQLQQQQQHKYSKKCIYSPFWIERVLREERLCGPSRPLHFPCSLLPVANASRHILACTGLSHSEREEVEAMARLMGAAYTSFLTPANTVLIAAGAAHGAEAGVKALRAKQWGIPIKSFAWLCDCFTKWSLNI